MHQKRLLLAIHNMFLDFGNIVGNIVDNVHVQVIGCRGKLFGESLPTHKLKKNRKSEKKVVPGESRKSWNFGSPRRSWPPQPWISNNPALRLN